MKKFIKTVLKLIFFLCLAITPFLSCFIVVEKSENPYAQTYLAEMNEKYELLKNTTEKKIIFVGGSSLPFGLHCDLIENAFPDYKVINFGLYATLGTKFMMDTSKININKGDIVILSPELNQQTYSLYFNPKAVLQAYDGYSNKINILSLEDKLELFYNYYDYAIEKMKNIQNTSLTDTTGIYRKDSFNEYGDIKIDRKSNIMNNGYDSTMQIIADEEILNQDFINYVNNYCSFVRNKNAKIYFNFSPCNELAIFSSLKTRQKFQKKLLEVLNCDLLSNLEECIIDYRYFYDTNFHLNSSGALHYTALLIKNLKMKLELNGEGNSDNNFTGNDDSWNGEIIIPKPPIIEEDPVETPTNPGTLTNPEDYKGEANIDFVDYFEYRLVGSTYQIIGIKDKFKDVEELILPSSYQEKRVTAICKDALYGCINLRRIYIGLTYKTFEAGCFNGCISLDRIYLYAMDGNTLSPASIGLLDGSSRNIKIYIPKNSNYLSGYIWSNYSKYFEYY